MAIYRAVLWLYPASFRAEYGREMSAIFARRWQQNPSLLARLWFCVDALFDALRNAPPLHFDILRQDVAFAVRTMARAPSLAITVVLVTGIGIGATTATFSLADHVLLKPLPFRDPERLVNIWQQPGEGGRLQASPGNFRDWERQATSFESMGAYSATSTNLVGTGDPLRLDGSWVSGDLFRTLGVSPLLGRALTPDDSLEGAALTVVISERLWRARFAADPGLVGSKVIVNDTAALVAGIMPRTFEFPTRSIDIWIPFQFAPDDYVYGTENPYLNTVARLKPGVTRPQALAEMQQIAREIARVNPDSSARISARVVDLRDEIAPTSRLLLWCLLAAAAGLLLIACTNIANLLLTRGFARHKEFAVRAALGAGRHRLTRQLLTESVLLAAAGGGAGVALAVAVLPTVARLVPTSLPIPEVPMLDLRLLLAALFFTLATVFGFGLVPSLRIARQVDATALHEGARAGVSRRTERFRSALVVGQIGASVALLVACGLLLRAALQVQGTNPGFTAEGVLTVRTALPVPKYDPVQRRHEFYHQVLGDVRALPGVTEAAYATGLPMVMRASIWSVTVPGQPPPEPGRRTASLRLVTPQFFATLRIPVRRGRDVADSDTQTSPPVAVVSESFANRYWLGQDPIGRHFRIQGRERTVVGVVGDVRVRGLERDSEPQVYLPSDQVADGSLRGYIPKELVIRSSTTAASLVPAIRAIVARADPQQPISDIQWLEDIVDAETAPRLVQVRVLGAFGAVAILLAAMGLHGLLAFNVSQRAREIGIRMALGANRRSVLALVMARGLRLAVAGIALGAGVALAAGRALESLLAGVSPTDLTTFLAATTLALVMTISGSLLPALRAIQVDPIDVIRTQ